MTPLSVAVVTAWKDHLELAPAYFEAVEIAAPDQLVIVDDGSAPALEFASIRLDVSRGFCGANNVGLAAVETDVVVMLNNDVQLLRADWLTEIVALVESGVIVAPLRFDAHGAVDGVAYPYGDGWCLAATTEDLVDLGCWDETYDAAGPAYFSDNALSFRARMAGMRLRESRPGLKHLGGQTGGADQKVFQKALAANQLLFSSQVRETLA